MKPQDIVFCAALCLAGAAPAAAGLFSAREIPSAWSDPAIKVDGSDSDWDADAVTEKEGLAISAANDDKYLYIYVAALDKDSAGQLSGRFGQTFTLWLDGNGGKKKVYGIKLSAKAPQEKAERPGTPDEAAEGKKRPEPKQVSYSAVMVSAGGEELNAPETDGAEFKAGLNRKRRPVLEFKFQLAKVPGKPGPHVGLGLETSDMDKSAMPAARGSGPEDGYGGRRDGRRMGGTPPAGGPGGGMGGPPPGGMGGGPGGGAGMGGGQGGPSGNGEPSLPDPINFWLKIKLAGK